MRRLGEEWPKRARRPTTLNILLSHLHLDHLLGLSSFKPLLSGEIAVRLWTAADRDFVESALRTLTAPPFLPFDLLSEKRLSVAALPHEPVRIGAFEATPVALNHPGGCFGFTIGIGDKRVMVVCDHEHGDPVFDAGVEQAARGVDLLVYDAPYTDAQYEAKRGWGHSTYSAGIALARSAGVKKLLFAHHSPSSGDDALDRIAEQYSMMRPPTILARDGDRIDL